MAVYEFRDEETFETFQQSEEFAELKRDYDCIVYAKSGMAAREAYQAFVTKWRKLCPAVAQSLEEAGERLLTFYAFPKSMWKSLRTTNSIENLNREFRRRTKTQASFSTEEAGVTLTTVSRILNKKGGKYADKTIKHVFEIADRLKYRPNALVLGMQTGRTNTAGVMIPTSEWFYSQIIAGIHEVFLDHEILMMLNWNSRSTSENDQSLERSIIHQLVDRRVDGIILRPTSEEFESSYFEEIWERDIPLILVDRDMTNVRTDFAGTDGEAGGKAAAEYLISLGHRNMLFIGEGEHVSTSRRREDGFRKVLSESPNACCRTIKIADAGDQLPSLLKQADRPTAIFCYNDPVAEQVIPVLEDAGLSIPSDISLLGFGNEQSGEYAIALSTFDQHPQLIGKTAAEMYLDRVNVKTANGIRRELINPDLIVRGSCGMPK